MSNNKTILIVDDDPRNIYALNAVLTAKGFNCITAPSARAGLETLGTKKINVALIDMMMPDMDGHQMIGEIRRSQEIRSLPVIAVTALAMPGDKEKCLQSGADDYLSKPINVDMLMNILQKHLQ